MKRSISCGATVSETIWVPNVKYRKGLAMQLNIYRPGRFHRFGDGTNWSSVGCPPEIPTRVQLPCICICRGTDGSIEFEMDLIGPAAVERPPRMWVPEGNARPSGVQAGWTGQEPNRATLTGQDGSIELGMGLIGPSVMELQRPQSRDGRTDGRRFYSLPYFLLQRQGTPIAMCVVSGPC